VEKIKPLHTNTNQIEGIDIDKLFAVINKNKWWIIIVVVLCNLFAYLTIRWTKNLFESQSEMKLDIKI
jgi:tyrosine-protein kinase Etk/Wzc